MVSSIFETIGEVITSFLGALTNVFGGVTSLIYNGTDGSLTVLGVLLLISAGCGIVYWAFNMIRGMVARKR